MTIKFLIFGLFPTCSQKEIAQIIKNPKNIQSIPKRKDSQEVCHPPLKEKVKRRRMGNIRNHQLKDTPT